MSLDPSSSQSLDVRIANLERELLAMKGISTAQTPRLPRRRRRLTAVALGLTLAAMPMLLIASHEPFVDVADSYLFHQEIGDLYNARVVTGTDATHYSPGVTVTRGPMAAFIHRSAGRVASDYNFDLSVGDETITLASTQIRAGGVSGGTGFLLVTGSAYGWTSSAGVCPCTLTVWVEVDGVASNGMYEGITDVGTPIGGSSVYRLGSATDTRVFTVESGVYHNVDLLVTVNTTSGTLILNGDITAVYAPLGYDGGLGGPSSVSAEAEGTAPGN